MKRRRFIRLLGGSAVFAAVPGMSGCSSELPEEALIAWQPPPDDLPVREWLLSHALLAPHAHNLQSWLVDLRQPGEITLYCDLTRLLPETDPFSRQIVISQGTFLELLAIAARQRGLRAEIETFPDGEFGAQQPDERPTARVRLVEDAAVRPDPLFAHVFERRTNRGPYRPDIPSGSALAAIEDSASGLPVRIGFVTGEDPQAMSRHREIAAEAWRIELTTPRTILESYRWIRVGPEEIARYRDGLTMNDPMIRFAAATGMFDRSEAPAPGDFATRSQITDFNDRLAGTPAFFWMITEGNDRRTQIETGRAYVRAQLAATANGLAMQPLSQALQEYPEQAATHTAIHRVLDAPTNRYTVQMWTRLGRGREIGPSPRRTLEELLIDH